MAQTKAELVEELEAQATKADLVELLQSRLRKDDIAKLLEDESGATKEELVHKLGSLKKDELVEAVANKLTKDEIEKVVEGNREDDDDEQPQQQQQPSASKEGEKQQEAARFESRAPRRSPRQEPIKPGQRVRVDISGLPMMGIYAGPRSSAAGTIVGVNPGEGQVQVYLDAVFDGEKQIVVPPERLVLE